MFKYLLFLFIIAITCSPLTVPINGSVTYSSIANENGTYAFDVVATYSCSTGFALVGNNTRKCTGDGSSITGAFDGAAPTCEGDSSHNYGRALYIIPSHTC